MAAILTNSELTSKLESILTQLAKACLQEQPRDVEMFCLHYLATKCGAEVHTKKQKGKGRHSSLEEEYSQDYAKVVSDHAPGHVHTHRRGYESSDDSHNDFNDDIKSVASYQTNGSRFGGTDDFEASKVKTTTEDVFDEHQMEAQTCYLFSTSVISAEELDNRTQKYKDDERMKSLFRAWDGDDSGAVDFVELVLALHKFEEVSRAGIDIQVAADALVQFVESDTDRELNLVEFSRVIILFALNNFKKDFDQVADHMLAVATSTSEQAVHQAARGADTTALEAADKAEQEFLRETVKCMEEQVTDNIRKIRTKRVAFRQSPRAGKTGNS